VLLDRLAEHLGASTVLEDQRQRTLAHSSQVGPIDSLRRDSILHRVTSPEVVEWFQSFGILKAKAPLAIPAHEELGILPRLCVPVRYRDHLLGFLWVIDIDGTLWEHHPQDIEKAADHAALLLYEDELAQRLTSTALSQLLSSSEELRSAAAQMIIDQGLLTDGQPIAIVIVQPLTWPDPSADVSLALKEALADVGWDTPTGSALRLVCSDHGVLLVGLRSCTDDALAFDLAKAARDALVHRLGPSATNPVRVVASIGDPQSHLDQAVSSYRQARLAIKVSAVIPALSDVVRWSELGVFRALAQLPTKEAQESALDPRLLSLLDAADETVISTLETFLDLAGDVKATAEALHLHRGTLYYRLEKAERLSGIDIHNGYDRLSVHLSLKLARLAGHRMTVPTVPPTASATRLERRFIG
jgi:DNA-binding PucR family transcriptional regulator